MKKLFCTCVLTAAMLTIPFGTVSAEETESVESEVEESLALDATDSQTLDACYSLALNAINAEDYESAKDYLGVCFGYCDADTNPDMYADLLLKQACINSIEGKNDLALRNLNVALRVKPDLADAYMVRTEVYVEQGNVDKAIEDLEKYIELTEDVSMYATVAQLQEAKGDMEAAQKAYDKYVEGNGEQDEEAGFQAGLYRMQNGNFDEAIAAFEAYKDNETYGAGAMYNIGVCKMDKGDFSGAVEAFKSCEEKGGAFEGLYYNRGVCHLLNEEWAEGAADFEVSVEKEPYTEDATYNLALCQMQQEDFEKAIATFTSYISGEKAEAESGAESAAEPVAESAAEPVEESSRPVSNYGAYYYRAVCEGLTGKLEEALADYTVCIENGYELTQSYYQRAQIYGALGDTENQNLDLAESLKYTE